MPSRTIAYCRSLEAYLKPGPSLGDVLRPVIGSKGVEELMAAYHRPHFCLQVASVECAFMYKCVNIRSIAFAKIITHMLFTVLLSQVLSEVVQQASLGDIHQTRMLNGAT